MGLFSSKTTVHIASVVYNLAGDDADRINYLKTTVATGILGPDSGRKSMGENIVNSLMNGPAMDQRDFYRWAKRNYTFGSPRAQIVAGADIPAGFDFTPYIPVPEGAWAEPQSVASEMADFFYWAERHILEYSPDVVGQDWTCDISADGAQVIIEYPDQTTETIPATGYVAGARYVYVYFDLYVPAPDDPPETGPEPVRRLWIYRVGSGHPELDEFISIQEVPAEFYPFISLRIGNRSIRDSRYAAQFPTWEKAYKKATGASRDLNELLDGIEDNKDIDDIDDAILVYGVPLNTEDNASRVYIYEFFRRLMPFQQWGINQYDQWLATTTTKSQAYSGDSPPSVSAPIHTHPVTTGLRIYAGGVADHYDVRIHWVTIDETVHEGKGWEGARTGECRIEKDGKVTVNTDAWFSFGERDFGWKYKTASFDNIVLTHQTGENSYRRLRVIGATHQNFVYKKHHILLRAHGALDDPEESGFIIPMHHPTVARMPLAKANDMCVGNAMVVFNCYEKVRQRWYQRGFFKVLFFVAAIAISVVLSPATGAGILGTALAVGTALGFVGTMALIVGAVVNALAAMILTTIIARISTELLGDEIGAIVAVVASFVALNMATNFAINGNIAFNWGDLMKAENILALTDSAGNAALRYAQGEIASIQEDYRDLTADYQERSREIDRLTEELLGYSGIHLDPLMMTLQDSSAPRAESRDTFLSRTLLTGSDIAEVSMNMIREFPRISLELPKYTA